MGRLIRINEAAERNKLFKAAFEVVYTIESPEFEDLNAELRDIMFTIRVLLTEEGTISKSCEFVLRHSLVSTLYRYITKAEKFHFYSEAKKLKNLLNEI